MDRRAIFADRLVEKGRGYMPAISINPVRLLFTSGLTGCKAGGGIIEGGMAAQTVRAFERLQPILEHAGAGFSDVIKQVLYVTDFDVYEAEGRVARATFFGEDRPASTGLVVSRLTESAMLIEVELVVGLSGEPQDRPLIEKYDVENHGLDLYQGVIVNGGRLVYLAGQVANNPSGFTVGIGSLCQQTEKVYENIGHLLQAVGGTPASVVKETTWVLNLEGWRQQGNFIRRAFYNGDFPASTLVQIPSLARSEFLVEIEVIAAVV